MTTTQNHTRKGTSPQDETITIPLTRGYETIVDAVDADLSEHKWHANPSWHTVYARRTVNKRVVLLHRVILARMIGRVLKSNEYVDHINGNALDNRRSNLRIATNSQNQMNQRTRTDNTSGYKGVHWHKVACKWQARVKINGRYVSGGLYENVEDAAIAARRLREQLHREFANTGGAS